MGAPSGSVPLALKDSDTSTTHSAIGDATIIVRSADGANDLVGLSRDTANANRVLAKPDEKKIEDQAELIQSTVALGKGIVGEVLKSKVDAAKAVIHDPNSTDQEKADANQEVANWSPGGTNRLLADIATGVIAAGLGKTGAVTSVGLVANTTAPDTYKKIGDYADQQYVLAIKNHDPATAAAWAEGGSARVLLHTLAGAVQGLSSDTVGANALGAGVGAVAMPVIDKALKESGLSQKQRQPLDMLIAAGLGAVTSGGGATTQLGSALTSSNIEAYNRQLHPNEASLIEKEAEKWASAKGITKAQAELQMGQALAYFVDKQFNLTESVLHVQIDAETLVHLATALAPLASMYTASVGTGDVPSLTTKIYTPAETLQLLQNYKNNQPAEFDSTAINVNEFFAKSSDGNAALVPFYIRNLNFSQLPDLFDVVTAQSKGKAEGVTSFVDGLKSLISTFADDPAKFSNNVAMTLVYGDPANVTDKTEAELARAFINLVQGNTPAIIEQYYKLETSTTLGSMGPAELGIAAKLGEAAEVSDAVKTATETLSGAPKVIAPADFVESASIQPNTTVRLSQDVTLNNGTVIPKGSVVTVADDTMKVTLEDGTSNISRYSANVKKVPLLDDANGLKGASPETGSYSPIVAGGGLKAHENAGGHLLERHVDVTDADLAERLATTGLSTVSRFTDRATAEAAVSAAIDANQALIDDYLNGTAKTRLIIEYSSSSPIGKSLLRGASGTVPASEVRVVIARDLTLPTGYKIITGYPHL